MVCYIHIYIVSNKNIGLINIYGILLDASKIDEYMMTRQEIMNVYGIKFKDIPVFLGYKCHKPNVNHISNFDWNDVFTRQLNKKKGGNTRDVIYSQFSKSLVCIYTYID